MRDREFRRKQNEKKSYKKFISEMNRGKLKGPLKGKRKKNIDYTQLSEEELEDLEDDLYLEESN